MQIGCPQKLDNLTFIVGLFSKKSYHLKVITYFCKERSIIGFSLGSKYGLWQYCQKSSHLRDISPILS